MTDKFDQIVELAKIQCSKAEIAAVLGISTDDFAEMIKSDVNIAAAIEYGEKFGQISIRRKQFEIMESGSADMAKWLGKQYLGQSDKVDQKTEISTADDAGITINFITPGDSNESESTD